MPLGLYVSRCGGRVEGVVDIESAVENARECSAVVRVFDDFFDPTSQERMVRDVSESGLDAIVLAGHSDEHYTKSLSGQHLKTRLVEAGVNPNKVVTANILEQVALTHFDDPAGATAKARAIIDVACVRADLAEEIEAVGEVPARAVMILGGTTEAIVAAQRLLQLGFSVVIADRGDGSGRARDSQTMRATAGYVMAHPNAAFFDHARLTDGSGWLGDYDITLQAGSDKQTFKIGGILLARPDVQQWIDELRAHFRVDIDDNGHARSIDPDTHPSETVEPGIMVVPVREGAGRVRDRVAVADSAAIALVLKLTQEAATHHVDVSRVDESLCGGCASCVRTCAFGACSIGEDGFSHVDIRRCRACGKCVVSCPVGARDIVSAPHDYLVKAIRVLAETDVPGERVLGFLCGGCGYPAGDSAATAIAAGEEPYPASFLPLRIPCGGRLDTLYVLEAFKEGFDAVTVFRCREGHCHNLIGNLDMDRRINLLRTVLRSRRIDDSRLRIVDISPLEGDRFAEQVRDVYATISGLSNGRGQVQ